MNSRSHPDNSSSSNPKNWLSLTFHFSFLQPPHLIDYDDVFNNGDTTLNLVAKSDTAAAFLILTLLFTLSAFILIIFGVGRVGHGETILKASYICLLSGKLGFM